MIFPIRKIGDPVLRTPAREVVKVTDETRKLIKDMFQTMYDAPGSGLAAPQIGVSQRIIVVDVDVPLAIINPVVVETRGAKVEQEGCLSIPGEWKDVERPSYVKVRGLDEKGRQIEVEGEDWMARALLHEIDHLDGILFVDRVGKKSGAR